MIDVLFVCDASPTAGFGHLARCVALATALRARCRELQIAFAGEYTERARQYVATTLSAVHFMSVTEIPKAHLAVIDRLADPNDMNSWDDHLAHIVSDRARSRFAILSGTEAPRADGFVRIGYQPGGPQAAPPELLWGFDFAPVSHGLLESPEMDRNARRALLAVGGDPHGRALELTLEALKTLPSIQHIDILASPMGVPIAPAQFLHQRQQFVIHEGVPSVAPLLRRAGVVIASHGNLAYEAMALGAPLCLIGQKPFQAALASRLSDQGLAVNSGLAASISAGDLAAAITHTLEHAAQLTVRARRHIDGRGLERISALLWRALDSSTEERCDARVRCA